MPAMIPACYIAFMKWAERLGWGAVVLGALLRVFHAPFAGVLLVLGFSVVATLYFPLGWLLFGRPSHKDQLVPLSVITGLVLSLLCIGMLFKLQLWPGADTELLLGLLGSVVVMGAILTLHFRDRGREQYFKGLRHRLLLVGLPALLLHLTPTERYIRALYATDPVRAELLIRLQEQPGDTAAQRQLMELDRRGRAE